jgi:hypothetical protein
LGILDEELELLAEGSRSAISVDSIRSSSFTAHHTAENSPT